MEEDIEQDLEELADEQQTIREKRIAQLRPYQYKKGQSGNSLGRYLGGLSGKERLKRKIAGMTDEEFEDFINGMNKKDLFEMAEGRPETKGELEHKGNVILQIDKDIAENNEIDTSSKDNSSEQSTI